MFKKLYLIAPRLFHHKSRLAFSNDIDLKTKILKLAMTNVNKYGWNEKAIGAACQDLGLSPVSHRLVPQGSIELVYFAMDEWNNKLYEELMSTKLEEMKISDRIKKGIRLRLSYETPYLLNWHQAMALGALPSNSLTTAQKLWKISDDIWYIAGDKSVDYNWYTKRSLLLSAYISTELFMLTDKSHNFKATWEFLDRRISEILQTGRNISTARNVSNSVFGGITALATMIHGYPQNPDNYIETIRTQYLSMKPVSQNQTETTDNKVNPGNQKKPEQLNSKLSRRKKKKRISILQ